MGRDISKTKAQLIGELEALRQRLADIEVSHAKSHLDTLLTRSVSSVEEKYRAMVEATGTGFVIVDANGRVLDANPTYVRLSGHSTLDEILGRSVIEWTAERDREGNVRAVRECLA